MENLKAHEKIAAHFFKDHEDVKHHILEKIRPYIQDNLNNEKVFNRFMGVFFSVINPSVHNQLGQLNENQKNEVIMTLEKGIKNTFDFKLHQLEQSHNYYIHGLLSILSLGIIYNCANNQTNQDISNLNRLNCTLTAISNLIILFNTSAYSTHSVTIKRPDNQNGTASYLKRVLNQNPNNNEYMALRYIYPLTMFLTLLNKSVILQSITLISVIYKWFGTRTNHHMIQFSWGKCPLPCSFKRLGTSNSTFNKDMTQTERSWFQRQIFDLFTNNELNQFTLRENISLSLTPLEYVIETIMKWKDNQKEINSSTFKKNVKDLVNNLKNPGIESPIQEISQFICMPGQLSVTELQESLYRMLRGKLTNETFCFENSIDFVAATNNMASSFMKSIMVTSLYKSITSQINPIKQLRSDVLQAEVLDMVPIDNAQELTGKRMTLLCRSKNWFKNPSEDEILKELKKQIQQISEETSHDELFRKVLKSLIKDFEKHPFEKIINMIHRLLSDLGNGQQSKELRELFEKKPKEQRNQLKNLFSSMNYVCLKYSLDEEKWQRFLKVLFNPEKLPEDLNCKLPTHDEWVEKKDNLKSTIKTDIFNEIEAFLKRHSDENKKKLNNRKKVLDDVKKVHRQLFGIWPGQLKGMILAITETSASTLIQLGKIPLKDQKIMAQNYLNEIKEKIHKIDPTSKEIKIITNQIKSNENRLDHINDAHIEYWLIKTENLLLSKFNNIFNYKGKDRVNNFITFLELMKTCINSKRLSSAIDNKSKMIDIFGLDNEEIDVLKELNKFKATNIWNSYVAHAIQSVLDVKQSAAITEFLSKAGAVPFIIGRNAFHILEDHSKNMSRVQQTNNIQFCNDHSPNHFRIHRYRSKNRINQSTVNENNFHKCIAAFGYAQTDSQSKTKNNENRRSCPGKLLPYHEISSALNVAALTGVAFHFQTEKGDFQDFNSTEPTEYNDHTLALSPKGRLITIEITKGNNE